MRDDTPTVYLLAGPSGAGKAAYVQALADQGVVRLVAEDTLNEDAVAELVRHVESGRDVMVEYGEAPTDERDRCKRLAESHGAQWCAVNFTIDHDHLAARLV